MLKLFTLALFASFAASQLFPNINLPALSSINLAGGGRFLDLSPDHEPVKKPQTLYEDYSQLMRYVPEQLGVKYEDESDKHLTTVGNSILGWGVYNQSARRNDFRRLKEQLSQGIQARRLYIQALDRELGLLKSVVDAVSSNIKTIQTRSATVVEEIDSAANENAF